VRLGRWFKPDPEREAAIERVRAQVRALLALPEDATVSVNEIECGDPSCPGGVETVILVRARASVTRAIKLPGPAAAVTSARLSEALAAEG